VFLFRFLAIIGWDIHLSDKPKIGDIFFKNNVLFQIVYIQPSKARTMYPYVAESFFNNLQFSFNDREVIEGKRELNEEAKTRNTGNEGQEI
jgi:hypothetical protein